MSVSKRLRYEILRRDNHRCRYCGLTAAESELRVDHVVPVALGGKDEAANLVAACQDCNAGKSSASADSALVDNVSDDAVRWARAMHRATELAQQDREQRYETAQAIADYWDECLPRWAHKPDDWERSVNNFRAAGLVKADLLEAVSIAANKYGIANADRWRYFCGVCNGMIRERQEAALELLRADEPSAPDPHPYSRDRDAWLPCERCGGDNCAWAVGYARGGEVILDMLGPTGMWAAGVHRQLSSVCDKVPI